MLPYLWLIPLAPLAGFLAVGLLTTLGLLSGKAAHRVAVTASALSFLLSVVMVWEFSRGVESYLPLAQAHPGQFEVAVGNAEQAARFEVTLAEWLPFGETVLRGWGPLGQKLATVNLGWSFSIDALTCLMLLVVSGIGTLIHIYSIGYMHGEHGYERFFAYLNLFMAMMLTLVLGANLLVLFVGWEGVGLCSYLLIGFYYDRMFDKEAGLSCADCGRKAFITNRIGDFGFMLGVLLLLVTFGTLDFSQLASAINGQSAYWYGTGLITLIGVLLFIGATGKSAQLPLYVWLPDAMAGPTPVSALIHAATMVTAGVYMLARMSAVYWHAPGAMLVVAVVGCLTAVFAGTMGLAQYDIKKVLAYSTVSQLGYMFLGAGVGAYTASVFHLGTHAFFKACLFLGAGSVIARCGHSNDMRLYGGLWSRMPWTAKTFLAATLAISGLPFLSGFMSKDEILAQTLYASRGSQILWALGTLGAVCTAFYMFRAFYMTFMGENRSPGWVKQKITESPRVMTGVLVVLAFGALFVGFLGIPAGVSNLIGVPDANVFEGWIHPVVAARGIVAAAGHVGEHAAEPQGHGEPEGHGVAVTEGHSEAGPVITEGLRRHPSIGEEWGLFLVACVVFAGGFLLARWAYGNNGRKAEELAPRLAFVRRILHRKWFVDELYQKVVIGPFYAISEACFKVDQALVDGAVNGTAKLTLLLSDLKAAFDNYVVDGAVNGVAGVVRFCGATVRRIQTGYVQAYAAVLVGGMLLLLAAYLFVTRI